MISQKDAADRYMAQLTKGKSQMVAPTRTAAAKPQAPKQVATADTPAAALSTAKPRRRVTLNIPAETEALKKVKAVRVRHVVSNTFRLGYLLHDVSRMRRTLFDQHLKPAGLTRSQWWVLAALSRKDGTGIMSSDLAKVLSVGKVTVGGLIDRLEAVGYVTREPGQLDRRSKLIYISAKGSEVINRMRHITEPLNREIVKGMTQSQVMQMETLLIRVKQNVTKMLNDNFPVEDDERD